MKKGHRDLALLGVFLLVGAYFGRGLFLGHGEDPRHDVSDDVARCKDHQRALYDALREYVRRTGALPAGDGPGILGALYASGVLGDSAEERALLTCPGPGAEAGPTDVDWTDASTFGADDTGYAFRDLAAHPLAAFPTGGETPILACDQARGANHAGALNVLYADGSVRTLIVEQLVEQQRVPPGTTALGLGPDSVLPALRVFPAGD